MGQEFSANTTTFKQQENAEVASLSDGGFVVAWQSRDQNVSDYGFYTIVGQRFDANGENIKIIDFGIARKCK